MRLLFAFLFFFLLVLNAYSAGLKIGYLAPSSKLFKHFSDDFLNGLYLGLPSDDTVVVQNAADNATKALEQLYYMNVDVVIGPFESRNVNSAQNEICSSGIPTILPFAVPRYSCSNVFVYNFDPIAAAKELAKLVSDYGYRDLVVLYENDPLDMSASNAFLQTISDKNVVVEPFDRAPLYDEMIKRLFGVRKIRRSSGLVEGKVYEHSLKADNVVIFAPQDDFVSIVNLLDYYSIEPQRIWGDGVLITRDLLSLNNAILQKVNIITPYWMCLPDPINVKFVEQYRENYNTDPNFMAALGYDIGRLIGRGTRGSTLDLSRVTDFDGLIGRLMFFDASGLGFINYRLVNYAGLERCRGQILSR